MDLASSTDLCSSLHSAFLTQFVFAVVGGLALSILNRLPS